MTLPTSLPGAEYVDALPTGEYAATIPTKPIATHLGPIALPPDEPWGLHYIQVSNVGGFHFGGQAHTRPNGAPPLFWEWRAGTWTSRVVPTGRGAYNQQGVFCDAAPAGIQFVSDANVPVSRLDTYNDPTHGLSEWSEIGGLRIGQGNGNPDGGVLVWDGTVKRVLVPPPTYALFVTTHRVGDAATVCYVGKDGGHILATSLSALRALPPVTATAPPPPSPTQPPTQEPPVPTVPAAEIARAKAMLATVRAEMHFGPNMDPAPYITTTATRLGYPWGLNGKRGNPNKPSGDVLAYDVPGQQPLLYDVVGDGGGKNSVAFTLLPYPEPAGAVFIRVETIPGPTNPPPPVDPPADPGAADLSARVGALEAALAHILASQEALEGRIDALPAPVALPDVSTFAVKGGKVTVSAKLPFVGSIVAHGTIDT